MAKRKKISTTTADKKYVDTSKLIPSGSTMLNLCCTDSVEGAYHKGKTSTIPGESGVGKTVVAITTFAEMNLQERFDDYDFIFDDVEEALEINITGMFSKELEERIKAPNYNSDNEPIYSNTIQDLKTNILNRIKTSDKPFVWIVDSLDALTTSQELEKEYKQALLNAKKMSDEHVKELKGSYKTEKAKMLGEILRMIKGNIRKTSSSVLFIQQARSKIGVTFGKKTTTSGGKAPKFYSTHRIWLYNVKTIKENGLDIGRIVKAEVTKNKITGKRRQCDFPIYDGFGIDDIQSCMDYIIKQGYWKKQGNGYVAQGLDVTGTRKAIIDYIEEGNLEEKLKKITQKVWDEEEEKVKLQRKKRY